MEGVVAVPVAVPEVDRRALLRRVAASGGVDDGEGDGLRDALRRADPRIAVLQWLETPLTQPTVAA